MADLAGAQFLRLGRKAEEGVDLSFGEQLPRGDFRARHPVDVLHRVEPDMGGHGGQEHVRGRRKALHAHRPALQIGDAANALVTEELEAPGMHASNDGDRLSGIDRDDQGRGEVQAEVDVPTRNRPRAGAGGYEHVSDIREAFKA
jgi:hypothetical protein